MYRLGIILESIENQKVLNFIKPYFYSHREEYVEGDECSNWHICEYHIENDNIQAVAEVLKDAVKETWYIHAFEEHTLIVILKGKYFKLPHKRDRSWIEMIKYGYKSSKVKKKYLKNIPLHI